VSDVGADARTIIPRFPDPLVVEFSGGKALGEFVQAISAVKSSRVEAAAGAGKSVKMPTELFKAIGGVLVHCVPARLLAVSLHDFVSSIATPDVPVNLCTEVTDEFPTSGLVFTHSAVLLAQVLRWKASEVDPGVLLYMDECHESDGSTSVIRSLRHALHGVSKYVESSATHGTGDVSSTFAMARLPSSVNEVPTPMPPPHAWDMTSSGVPWSLRKLSGDIVVFTDDEDEARVVMGKFSHSGLKTYRMTGYTSVDEYRSVMSALNVAGDGVVSVLVLDYTFRSGFSFPTVDRFIDLSRVKIFVNHGGKTVTHYRQPYNAEVYQTKNRGGRIKGRNCNYFRLVFEPQNVQVFLEGAEAMIACLWYRMLGYDPGAVLEGTPMYAGKVPRNVLVAMRGRLLMNCYALDQEWPGKAVVKRESLPASPVVLETPRLDWKEDDDVGLGIDSSWIANMQTPMLDTGVYGAKRAGPPSVFSLGEDQSDDDLGTEEAFREAHRKSVAKGRTAKRDERVPPVPPLDETYRTIQNINDLRKSVHQEKLALSVGKYYRLHGFDGDIRTGYFADGVYGVVNAAGDRPVHKFVSSLPNDAALEARQRALMDVNRATVKYAAVSTVLTGVQKQRDKFDVLDPNALRQWFELMRDVLMSANVTIRDGFKILETAGYGEVLEVSNKAFVEDEKGHVQCVLNLLSVCVSSAQGVPMLSSVTDDVDSDFMSEVLKRAGNYEGLGGRVNMKISGRSLRERLANKILGGRAVQVDAILA